MKRLFAFSILSALFLSACSSGITVATPEEIEEFPELKGAMKAWQSLSDAAAEENCEDFRAQMRLELFIGEEECPAAFEWFATNEPTVDWSRSQWSGDMGKVKISRESGGGITAFILDTSNGVWGADTRFWE